MAKSSKKVPVKSTKVITEFFTRKSVTGTPNSLRTITHQSERPLAEKATKTHIVPSITHTISTGSHLSDTTTTTTKLPIIKSDASNISLKPKPRTFMEAVEIVSPRKKNQPNRSYTPNPPISFNSMHNAKGPVVRSKSTSLVKRISKFDSDSDKEGLESVVYISKSSSQLGSTTSRRASQPLRPKENLSLPTQSNARKKPRLASPDPGVKSVMGEVVPSSLSDEQELLSTRAQQRDPALVKQHVDEWRQMAVPPIPTVEMDPFVEDMPMDLDPGPSSPLSDPGPSSPITGGNSESKSSRASTLLASPMFGGEDTPPQLDRTLSFSPLPSSPLALDPETKTAMIIAKIREKAYADNMSSPSDDAIKEFKDELDDSSDEENIILWSPTKGKGRPANTIMAPQPSPVNNQRRSGRLSKHNTSLSPSNPTSPTHSRRTRTVPNRGPTILTQYAPTKKGKEKAFNPLEKLLREKKLAHKQGKDDVAFLLAEGAIASKGATMDGMIPESDSADWSNEAAAQMAVAERARTDMKSSSPVASGIEGGGGDVLLTDQDPERLLGEKHGKAVVNILDGDEKKKQVEKEGQKFHGVPLWSSLDKDNEMVVDQVFPILTNTGNNTLVHSLNTAIQDQDFVKAMLLLDSGALGFIDLTQHPSVIPYLCALALSPHETPLNRSASRLLSHIWCTTPQAVPGLSFDLVLTTLVKLGAEPSILNSLDWDVEPYLRPEMGSIQQREEILYHLVSLVASSAKARRLPNEQSSDMIMAMLIIAHDPTSPPELYQEIVLAIDEICRSIAPTDELFKSLEAKICNKILHYITYQTSINKAFIINIFAAGTGRTRRIARWIAHALVTRSTQISPVAYCDLPPLLPILDQLKRITERDSTESPGMFELHDKTDYVDLGFHVQVLAVALSKVRAYVGQEQVVKRAPANFKNPDKSQEMLIQQIQHALERRHASISDVRAAHLDRSRAKAALKELSMRIHYQILSSRGGGTAIGKPRNLRQYFGTKAQDLPQSQPHPPPP